MVSFFFASLAQKKSQNIGGGGLGDDPRGKKEAEAERHKTPSNGIIKNFTSTKEVILVAMYERLLNHDKNRET